MNEFGFWRPMMHFHIKSDQKTCLAWFEQCNQIQLPIYQLKRVSSDQFAFAIDRTAWKNGFKQWILFRKSIRANNKRMAIRIDYPRLKMIDQTGFLLWGQQLLKQPFLISGLTVFLMVLFFCSQFIWQVQIQGASIERRKEVADVLQQIGFKQWAWLPPFADVERVARTVQFQVPSLAWVSVQRTGTRYIVEIEEMRKNKGLVNPVNHAQGIELIATKDAVVSRLEVEKGKPIVLRYTPVRKGDVLVSAWIGSEQHSQLVRAEGTVFGYVWKKIEVEYPLRVHNWTFSGKYQTKQYVQFGRWFFDMKNDNQKQVFQNEEIKTRFSPWKIGPFTLGVGWREVTHWETLKTEKRFSRQEAEKKAILLARSTVRNQSGRHAKLRVEKVLQVQNIRDKVKLSILYETDEPISTSKPVSTSKPPNL